MQNSNYQPIENQNPIQNVDIENINVQVTTQALPIPPPQQPIPTTLSEEDIKQAIDRNLQDKRCCFCMEIRRGCMAIGLINMIGLFISLFSGNEIIIVTSFIQIIATIIAVIGISKYKMHGAIMLLILFGLYTFLTMTVTMAINDAYNTQYLRT